jgi:GntR family transcriptional regulator
MITIDIYSRTPIYQQIVDGIKRQILLGILQEGEQIASVREFSGEAGVNPNTVSKAYLELERLGILVGAAGKGYFVSPGAYTRLREKTVAEEKKAFLDASLQLMQNGITESQLTDWLRELFSEGGTHV